MLRLIVLVYSLACISHVFGKPHQAKNFARDSAPSPFSALGTAPQPTSMWSDTGSPTTPISPTSTITVLTTGVAGSITVIEFPTTDSAGVVSTVTSTLTDGGNGASPTSPGSPPETKTLTIKPHRIEAEAIIMENGSDDTVYVEIILSTLSNSPGSSPITTGNTDPATGSQATPTASGSAPSGTGWTNANHMHKRENREWKHASTWVNMLRGKSEPPNE